MVADADGVAIRYRYRMWACHTVTRLCRPIFAFLRSEHDSDTGGQGSDVRERHLVMTTETSSISDGVQRGSDNACDNAMGSSMLRRCRFILHWWLSRTACPLPAAPAWSNDASAQPRSMMTSPWTSTRSSHIWRTCDRKCTPRDGMTSCVDDLNHGVCTTGVSPCSNALMRRWQDQHSQISFVRAGHAVHGASHGRSNG